MFGAHLPGGLVLDDPCSGIWSRIPALGFGLCLEHGHPHNVCVDNCPQPISVDVNPSVLLASPSGSPKLHPTSPPVYCTDPVAIWTVKMGWVVAVGIPRQ